MPDASNLLGTTSPLLNSEGFRISCGCGAAVSEHLTGNTLMRISEGLNHLWSPSSDRAPPTYIADTVSPTVDDMLFDGVTPGTGDLDKRKFIYCHFCAALNVLSTGVRLDADHTGRIPYGAAVATSRDLPKS